MDIFIDPVFALLSDLWNPQKRIFVGYLIAASLLAALVLRLKNPGGFFTTAPDGYSVCKKGVAV